MEFYVKIYLRNFFQVFNHDFIVHTKFSNIAVSNSNIDDFTNWVTLIIFNANL